MRFIKNYYLSRKIKQNISQLRLSGDFDSNKIKKIVCLIDADKVSITKDLEKIASYFSIRPKDFLLIGYKDKNVDSYTKKISLYTYKDISLRGAFLSQEIKQIKSEKYNILINYFDEPKKELLLLSSEIKAELRVGLSGIDEAFNDIIINCNIRETKLFISELKKILQTLK